MRAILFVVVLVWVPLCFGGDVSMCVRVSVSTIIPAMVGTADSFETCADEHSLSEGRRTEVGNVFLPGGNRVLTESYHARALH